MACMQEMVEDIMWDARHGWGSRGTKARSGLHFAAPPMGLFQDWGAHPSLRALARFPLSLSLTASLYAL